MSALKVTVFIILDECNTYWVSIVDANALVLQHQGISNHSTDKYLIMPLELSNHGTSNDRELGIIIQCHC